MVSDAVAGYGREVGTSEGETALVGGPEPTKCQSGQSVADRKRGCRCSILTGSLIEDVGEVIGHSFLTESQGMRDLAIALALGNQLEHRHLTLGQTSRKRCVCQTSWTRGKRA